MENLQCCVTSREKPLNQNFWDSQYQSNTAVWNLGEVSPPLKSYIDTLKDKNVRILIHQCFKPRSYYIRV